DRSVVLDSRRALVEKIPRGHRLAMGHRWVRGLEEIRQELRDVLRAVAVPRDLARLDRHRDPEDREREDAEAGRGDTEPVALDGHSRPLAGASAPRGDR